MTDMIMSKQYIAPGRKTLTHDAVEDDNEVPGEAKPLRDVKLVSLEIDDNDYGTDPYNRTGSFCVTDFDEE